MQEKDSEGKRRDLTRRKEWSRFQKESWFPGWTFWEREGGCWSKKVNVWRTKGEGWCYCSAHTDNCWTKFKENWAATILNRSLAFTFSCSCSKFSSTETDPNCSEVRYTSKFKSQCHFFKGEKSLSFFSITSGIVILSLFSHQRYQCVPYPL